MSSQLLSAIGIVDLLDLRARGSFQDLTGPEQEHASDEHQEFFVEWEVPEPS